MMGPVQHFTVYTQGQKIPGMSFMGETMTCAICNEVKVSDPAQSSQWTKILYGPDGRYYCTKHTVKEVVDDFVAWQKQQRLKEISQ